MYSFYLKLNKTKLWQRTKRFVYVTSVNKVNQSINQNRHRYSDTPTPKQATHCTRTHQSTLTLAY